MDGSPHPRVATPLDAIGRALHLDPDARRHLFRLAGLHPRLGPDNSRNSVHPALLRLLDAFPTAAAYVLSPAFEVLATNNVAAALLSPFTGPTNMVRVLFQHPQARAVFPDWPSSGLTRRSSSYPAFSAARGPRRPA
ncbi:hypothetical protein AB0283_17335 [Micromonospora vinacea]|uniref:MmyB family transcriptional regulator n=1 Tax=Micromonospora vinacea TaxID=709878 RepID=UPI00344ED0E9